MSDVNQVSYGKPKLGGAISTAPIGTELPKDAVSVLPEIWKNLGYISEDGMTNSNSPDSEKIKAWGGDTVLVTSTENPDTFEIKLLEVLNIDVLKTIYGEKNVSGDLKNGVTIKANASEREPKSYVADMILRGNTLKRIVIPNGVISELGDIEYVDNDATGYPATIEALPDKDGNTHYEYIMKAE